MKKFISIALAALTAVGLFGCSQDNAEDVSRISELEAQVGSLEASIAALESEKNGLDSRNVRRRKRAAFRGAFDRRGGKRNA